jgi:hypothetical protein
MGGHNNQPIVGISGRGDIGEETRPGRNVGRGCCLFVPGGKLNDKKNSKIKYIAALDGRRPINTHNNQLKTCGRNRGEIGQDAQPAGSAGGARFDRYGGDRAGRGG